MADLITHVATKKKVSNIYSMDTLNEEWCTPQRTFKKRDFISAQKGIQFNIYELFISRTFHLVFLTMNT